MEARLAFTATAAAMAKLPEEQRVAVALVLVDGMAYRDAAEVLGVPIGTLTSRLFRARAALAAASGWGGGSALGGFDMTISDEMLMAYLDNELAADERARVDAALMADADLRVRLERQARVHVMLDKAFGPLVNDPVPERFVDLVHNTPVSWRWRLSRAFAGCVRRR